MSYLNEFISAEDRTRYKLADFDSRIHFAVPSSDWVIDRERGIFLRLVVPSARRNEPGDPEAVWEKDFHFHWHGNDMVVQTRSIDGEEMQALPGIVHYQPGDELRVGRIYAFYIHHIWGFRAAFLEQGCANGNELLKDLGESLAAGCGGAFVYASHKNQSQERYAVLKLAPSCFKDWMMGRY